MKAKRQVGRFVLIEADIKCEIAVYNDFLDKIVICYGNSDCITGAQMINKIVRENNFLERCKPYVE